MRILSFMLFKEFRQILRNRAMLPIIFVVPFVQLIILANAADFEVKNIRVWLIDQDHSNFSRRLSAKFEATDYFILVGSSQHEAAAEAAMDANKADLVLRIPANFEGDLVRYGSSTIQLVANAIDGVKGGLAAAYSGRVIQDFNGEILEEWSSRIGGGNVRLEQVTGTWSFWFNPSLDYKTFMVPGILGLLVTMIGAFLSSMNITREKEIGTIEQLNVTPIRKWQFILGKLLPFLIIGLFELALGLAIGKLLYDIPIVGSLPLLFGFATLYLLVILGFGLLVSTLTDTQQQAMFISWFFMVVFIFLSGFFTAIENMPEWARFLTFFNPMRYFMDVLRMVLLKGAGFWDILWHFEIMTVFAVSINGFALWRYRKKA